VANAAASQVGRAEGFILSDTIRVNAVAPGGVAFPARAPQYRLSGSQSTNSKNREERENDKSGAFPQNRR
jgi:NAD(P)-dependent dehydrogenase (short-subunit alcohol dehydrogenase family)